MSNHTNFIGTYLYSMDAKNRVAIPSKFRSMIKAQQELILSQGLEGCLDLYVRSSWTKLMEKLENFPLKNKNDQRAIKRILFSSASYMDLDEEGRILIPHSLAHYAQLKKDVVILGVGEKVEVWALERWSGYQKRLKGTFLQYANQLGI